eukprot:1159277-Pelagomonas_calceolata.AAC.4
MTEGEQYGACAAECTTRCAYPVVKKRVGIYFVFLTVLVHAPRTSPTLRTAALRAARAPDVLYAAAAAAHDVHNGAAASAALLALTSLLGGGSSSSGSGKSGEIPVLPPTPATDDAVCVCVFVCVCVCVCVCAC